MLDFGLAKALDSTAGGGSGATVAEVAASPTLTMGATQRGVILGTAAYISPEQAEGAADVDARAEHSNSRRTDTRCSSAASRKGGV